MSVWGIGWALDQKVKPAGRKFVLVVLGNFADEDGISYPSQKTLAVVTAQSERAVRDHLDQLELAALIQRRKRYRPDGTRTSDQFQLAGGFRHRAANPQAGDKSGKQQDASKPPADSAGSDVDYRQISPRLPADSSATTGNGCRGSVSDPSEDPKRSSSYPPNQTRKPTERERRFADKQAARPLTDAEAKRGLEHIKAFLRTGAVSAKENNDG
jgi:hypothetical protein